MNKNKKHLQAAEEGLKKKDVAKVGPGEGTLESEQHKS